MNEKRGKWSTAREGLGRGRRLKVKHYMGSEREEKRVGVNVFLIGALQGGERSLSRKVKKLYEEDTRLTEKRGRNKGIRKAVLRKYLLN